jgi:glycosyltransferase involved in cell wall biosynthesis
MKETSNATVVPIGVNYQRIHRLEDGLINRQHLVYLGFLDKKRGLELIIDALPDIIKKSPDVRIIIIGGGRFEEYYRKQINDLGLTDYVDFKGYIKDHEEVETLLSKCAVGLAIYEPYDGNFTWYTDPSKPKQYMACGLPVIITGKPEIAGEIQKRKMGIAIDYEKNRFIDAVTLLLHEDKLYFEYRKNAINFASQIEWSAIFDGAFRYACS